MKRTVAGETLAKQKLATFEELQPEFEANFHFIQEVHGQRRFAAFPVTETVHYLHALWVCEWKERLLSVHLGIGRYEGQQCLSLLRRWQEGETADVVAFLQRKLGGLPFADLTRQIQEATTVHQADDALLQRLVHGRLVLLNRDMNLMQAFDAIFALAEDDLISAVQVACAHYGHAPSQIEQQLAEVENPLFSYAPHPLLAQRNMQVKNTLGMNVVTLPTDLAGGRSWKVVAPTEPQCPFAESVIRGYLTLLSRNNLMRHRFVGRPERTGVTRGEQGNSSSLKRARDPPTASVICNRESRSLHPHCLLQITLVSNRRADPYMLSCRCKVLYLIQPASHLLQTFRELPI